MNECMNEKHAYKLLKLKLKTENEKIKNKLY